MSKSEPPDPFHLIAPRTSSFVHDFHGLLDELESLHHAIVDLEAMAHAAAQVLQHMPYLPSALDPSAASTSSAGAPGSEISGPSRRSKVPRPSRPSRTVEPPEKSPISRGLTAPELASLAAVRRHFGRLYALVEATADAADTTLERTASLSERLQALRREHNLHAEVDDSEANEPMASYRGLARRPVRGLRAADHLAMPGSFMHTAPVDGGESGVDESSRDSDSVNKSARQPQAGQSRPGYVTGYVAGHAAGHVENLAQQPSAVVRELLQREPTPLGYPCATHKKKPARASRSRRREATSS